jgi:glycosyltransferase involved in cell wall biosynthesis
VVPLRPTGHLIYDYIQQVRPDVFPRDFDDSGFVVNAQRARFVLCTTPFTARRAVDYAGVDPRKVHVVDMEIEVDLEEAAQGGRAPSLDRPYALWPTNSSPHKNQIAALDAIDLYLRKYRGGLDVLCTGFNTSLFDLEAPPLGVHDDPWIKSVRDRIARSPVLVRHLRVLGELEERDYFATLAGARFLFHPALVDNGTFAVTEAAWFGVPSLVHDYPAMRWMDERFGLGLAFCDARDPEATARALRWMEDEAEGRRDSLPGHDALRRHAWRSHAADFWRTVGRLMEQAA